MPRTLADCVYVPANDQHQLTMQNPSTTVSSAKPSLWGVAGFTVAYIVAAVAVSLLSGNGEFVFYIVVMLVLIAAIGLLHSRVTLSAPILWALSVWGLLHMAGGLVPVPAGWPYDGDQAVLYSLWLIPDHLKYDQIVHAYGFGTTTWVCWHVLSHSLRAPDGAAIQPSLGLLILCVAAGIGFGALNEVIEFIAVLSLPSTNVGGYVNTGWDLISNLTGATLAAITIRLCSRQGG